MNGTDGRLNLVQPHPVQLLTTVYPALVADLVVDGQRSIGVLVSRKHRGSETTSWLRHAVLAMYSNDAMCVCTPTSRYLRLLPYEY